MEGRPEETRRADALTIACRAALRVIPIFVSRLGEDWALENGWIALPVLRCVLASGVVQNYPTPKYLDAAESSGRQAYRSTVASSETIAAVTTSALMASGAAAFCSTSATSTTIHDVVSFACSTVKSAGHSAIPFSTTSLRELARVDAMAINREQNPIDKELWPGGTPEWAGSLWKSASDWLAENPGHDFWIRWYEAALEGRPLTGEWDSHWQMLHDIALIPNEDWEQGAEHVAGLIDVIAEKKYLQRQVQDLKQRISDELFNQQTLGQHSHNLPDDLPASRLVEYRIALNEAKDTLLELEEALEPPIPDPTLLNRLEELLKGIRNKLAIVLTVGTAAAAGSFGTAAGSDIYNWLVDEGLPHLSRTIRDTPVAPQKTPSPKLSGKR